MRTTRWAHFGWAVCAGVVGACSAGNDGEVSTSELQAAVSPTCGTAVEDGSLTLSCPSGQVIKAVKFASYGTPSGSCGSFAKTSCDATTSESVVAAACEGNASCTLTANNATFGDPCHGTRKRLDVDVTCGSRGSGSEDAGACIDIPPPSNPGDPQYTCQQQAGWGKCGEPWIQGYCLASCGVCIPGTGSGGNDGGGTGGGTSCGHDPVDPQATPQARKLLCYLYGIYGKKVLSGQQEQSWASDPDVDNSYIESVTGKLPALRGQDFLYQQTDGKGRTTTSRAVDWWSAGGIAQLIYHMGNPAGDDSYTSALQSCGSGCIRDAITVGTAKNNVLMQRLDHAATELGKLQAANVAVVWRPWHESNGKWFWWGMEGGAELIRLFRFTYDYFVKTKGLHNLVWEVSWAQNNPDNTWDPGKAYYDIAGPDTYDSASPFSGQFSASRNIVGTALPISLQENGLLPDPSQMFNGNQAPWLFWNTWTQFEYEPGNQYGKNPKSYTQKCYSDAHTITRDMVPNLK